jgi:hypothetical protein
MHALLRILYAGLCRQGFTVEGNEFVDTRGVGKQVWLWSAPNLVRPPYWDHDFFLLRKGE